MKPRIMACTALFLAILILPTSSSAIPWTDRYQAPLSIGVEAGGDWEMNVNLLLGFHELLEIRGLGRGFAELTFAPGPVEWNDYGCRLLSECDGGKYYQLKPDYKLGVVFGLEDAAFRRLRTRAGLAFDVRGGPWELREDDVILEQNGSSLPYVFARGNGAVFTWGVMCNVGYRIVSGLELHLTASTTDVMKTSQTMEGVNNRMKVRLGAGLQFSFSH